MRPNFTHWTFKSRPFTPSFSHFLHSTSTAASAPSCDTVVALSFSQRPLPPPGPRRPPSFVIIKY